MKKLLLSLSFLVLSLSSVMGQMKTIVMKGDYDIDSLWLSIYGVPRFDESSPIKLNPRLIEIEFAKLYIEYSKKIKKVSVLDSTLKPATAFHAEYIHKNYLLLQDINLIYAKTAKQNPHFEPNVEFHDMEDRLRNVAKKGGYYYGEILSFVPVKTYKHNLYYMSNVKLYEKEMAKLMFEGFLSSPHHKAIMDNEKANHFYLTVIQENTNFVIVVNFIGVY